MTPDTAFPLHRITALALVVPLALGLSGCGDGAEAAGDRPQAERITRGDTTIVRNAASGLWAGARLVEEVRIGTLDGRDEEMFGGVLTLAADRNGGVYVFDGQVPALRHFDADGRYVRTLGREGSGPGEYRDAVLGLAVLSDGRVLMRDPRNARINIYRADGEPLDHWPVESGLFTANAMVADTAGHLYLKTLTGEIERDRPWPIGLLHLDATGAVVDTIHAPAFPGEPTAGGSTPFSPQKVWEMSPRGDLVIGVTSDYLFEVRRRDGTVLRIERDHEPVAVHPEHRAELEARNQWMRRNQGQHLTADIPPVPAVKPAYRGFLFDDEGRTWVHVHTPSERFEGAEPRTVRGISEPMPAVNWREPSTFDVFEHDGTFLGRVEVPARTTLRTFRGNRVWAVQLGELDEPYLVRYRLEVDEA